VSTGDAVVTAPATPAGSPSALVAQLTWRRTWKGAASVGAANVLVTVTAVVGYAAAYPDPADRVGLARSIGSNPGLTALFGETRALETMAGFTEWRVVLALALVGGIWAMFATTRVLRGEEDAGRAEVVLAGPVTRRGAAAATLAGLLSVWLLCTVITVLGLVAGSGRDLGFGPAALLGLTLTSTAAVMVGVSAVTSQLAATRRRATGAAAGVLGLSYAIRVVADSTPDLRWLRWWTPLGWLEEIRPLTGAEVLPLALTWLLAVVLGGLAVWLVARRDTGEGVWSADSSARPRTALLTGPLGLAVRLARGQALSWALGLVGFGALIGLVARTASEAMASSTGTELLGRLGVEDAGARAYTGVSFVVVTLALGLVAAGQVAALRDEEASARLDVVLTRPVGRLRWLAGRAIVACGLVVVASAAAVTGAAVAGSVGDLGVATGDLVVAGVNAVPAALLVLGLGVLVFGTAPRAAAPLTYAYVAGSFLLETVGAAVELPGLLLDLSVLHHVAPAPAVDPDWRAAGVMVVIGTLAAVVGGLAFTRRDLEGR
jgi:polyether ionophore transport system permease protein